VFMEAGTYQASEASQSRRNKRASMHEASGSETEPVAGRRVNPSVFDVAAKS
jgi:hypothetical protein